MPPPGYELRSRSKKQDTGKAKAQPSAPTRNTPSDLDQGAVKLSLKQAFRLLLIVRVASAVYNIIQDCDEVYNFWEPMHYLLQGYGLETWEYSPQFGIRSWAYIAVHALVGGVARLIASNKFQVFYLLRIVLAACSSFAEARFYRTITEKINAYVGLYVFIALFFSAGIFHAATAFLPSSFAMTTTFMAFSYILQPPTQFDRKRTFCATFWLGLGALLGWPFSAAIGIPFVIEEILIYGPEPSVKGKTLNRSANWRIRRMVRLAEAVLLCTLAITAPIMAVDYMFYKRWSFIPLNIVLYNVFGGEGRGPAIFGTEPWYFYILNGLLNFNVLFLLSLGSAFCLLATAYVDRKRVPEKGAMEGYISLGLKLAPFYLWFTIFSLQPHKEERFLSVAYPLIALNAAFALFLIGNITKRIARVTPRVSFITFTPYITLILFSILSISRIIAVLRYYRAPLQVYTALWKERAPDQIMNLDYIQEDYPTNVSLRELNVCVGKEWHRFPSSFFLPSDTRLRFIKSDFDGLLPKPFEEDVILATYEDEQGETHTYRTRAWQFEGTRTVHSGHNDRNKEDMSVYFPIDQCDYLVDADFPLRTISTREPRYIDDVKSWEILECRPFLDAENSDRRYRPFYVPWAQGLQWGDYCLLKRRT